MTEAFENAAIAARIASQIAQALAVQPAFWMLGSAVILCSSMLVFARSF